MKKIILVAVILISGFIYGCQREDFLPKITQRKLIIYSTLNNNFVNALVDSFNSSSKANITAMAVDELNGEKVQADVVLATATELHALTVAETLTPVEANYLQKLDRPFKGENNTWVGLFYDPVVLLINQKFSRKFGQNNLHSWKSLNVANDVRIVMENFNNSSEQKNLFCAFASNMGEIESIDYFSGLNQYVTQYTKYPFTPIRMVVAGDADVAVTSRSYIAEYLENDFPAYIVEPQEGTPIVLYGAGIYKGTDSKEDAIAFIDWLQTSEEAKNIILNNETGYHAILPVTDYDMADTNKLWLNTEYLEKDKSDKLIDKWLHEVRFRDEN